MHKIHAKEFVPEDFSIEQLISEYEYSHDIDGDISLDYLDTYCGLDFCKLESIDGGVIDSDTFPIDILNWNIAMLNRARELYLETKDKRYWWQMIQLLPTSYNQKRTVMMNYENLSAMYRERRDHKLDEWHDFCDWIKGLPYSELIYGRGV